jgi:hypothetical protein
MLALRVSWRGATPTGHLWRRRDSILIRRHIENGEMNGPPGAANRLSVFQLAAEARSGVGFDRLA